MALRRDDGPMALTLRKTPSGWLAVSDTYPRIGVQGETEHEARAQFEISRRSWDALLDIPMPTPDDLDGE